MKKQNTNYLDKIPKRNPGINYTSDKDGIITLEIQNKGIFNKLAQLILKKPKISYIHLDKLGSFVWPIIDGQKSIFMLGQELDEKFGKEAHPLYERLAKYFQILESYGFVKLI